MVIIGRACWWGKSWNVPGSLNAFVCGLWCAKDGHEIEGAKVTKLIQVASPPAANVCRKSSFVNRIEALINYTWAFRLPYRVPFRNARRTYIVNDAVSSQYLDTRCCCTGSRCVWFARVMITNLDFLSLREERLSDSSAQKHLGIRYLNKQVLYVSKNTALLLLVATALFLVLSSTKMTALRTCSLCMAGRDQVETDTRGAP